MESLKAWRCRMVTVEVGCDGILRQLRRRFGEWNDKKVCWETWWSSWKLVRESVWYESTWQSFERQRKCHNGSFKSVQVLLAQSHRSPAPKRPQKAPNGLKNPQKALKGLKPSNKATKSSVMGYGQGRTDRQIHGSACLQYLIHFDISFTI